MSVFTVLGVVFLAVGATLWSTQGIEMGVAFVVMGATFVVMGLTSGDELGDDGSGDESLDDEAGDADD